MKIRVCRVGGIAAIARPAAHLDTAELAGEEQNRVRRLIDAAQFFELPEELPGDPAARDVQSTVIEIDDGGHCHRVGCDLPTAPEPLRDLVRTVRALAASRRPPPGVDGA